MKKRFENLKPEAIRAGAAAWLRERIDVGPLVHFFSKKTVPVHGHSWMYLLGGAAAFAFLVQVTTGCLLMLYYQPTEAAAHESVQKIMLQVPYGWLVRSVHVWGANLFIAFAALHFLTVLFTRSYRKPRELTWVFGMLLLFLALGSGFSGYLLPWNELAYHATLVGTKIPDAVPGIGPLLVRFLRGGEQVTGDTLTRFFAAHVVILPLTFVGLLSVHLLLVQFQGVSVPLGKSEKDVRHRPFFSEFLLLDAAVCLTFLGLIVTLAVLLPAETGQKADPLSPAPEGIRPEWYFLFMFKTLKLVPESLGVAFFTAAALFLLLVPFLDRKASLGQRSPHFTAAFVGLLAYAAIFEGWAWLAPGAEAPPEEFVSKTYSMSGGAVSLALFWLAIGFLLFYLRQLLRENARIRQLYREANAALN